MRPTTGSRSYAQPGAPPEVLPLAEVGSSPLVPVVLVPVDSGSVELDDGDVDDDAVVSLIGRLGPHASASVRIGACVRVGAITRGNVPSDLRPADRPAEGDAPRARGRDGDPLKPSLIRPTPPR